MSPLDRTRIDKAAADCGFDLTAQLREEILSLRSTQFPEQLEVRVTGDTSFELRTTDHAMLDGFPRTQSGWTPAVGYEMLYAVMEQMAAIGRTMPDRIAEKFQRETSNLPRSTEAERLVVQRVGQDLFRNALLDYWHGRCCITGLAVPDLLRASHIKPWARCETDTERLNVFNGLLLSPTFDALFDGGWITVAEQGAIVISDLLPLSARIALRIEPDLVLHGLSIDHEPFLSFHRAEVFRRAR